MEVKAGKRWVEQPEGSGCRQRESGNVRTHVMPSGGERSPVTFGLKTLWGEACEEMGPLHDQLRCGGWAL